MPPKQLLLALALVALIAVGVWQAERLLDPEPRRWPAGAVIHYYNLSDWDLSLELAAGMWNRSNLGVRFAETREQTKAEVFIIQRRVPIRHGCPECGGTVSEAGYHDGDPTWMTLRAPAHDDQLRPDSQETKIIAHELGHVLGLEHVRGYSRACVGGRGLGCNALADPSPEGGGCALMARSAGCIGLYKRLKQPQGYLFNCGPQKRDLAEILDLYPSAEPPAFCWSYLRPLQAGFNLRWMKPSP